MEQADSFVVQKLEAHCQLEVAIVDQHKAEPAAAAEVITASWVRKWAL